MIYTVTLNPAIDKTLGISDFTVNEVNRVKELRIDIGGKGLNVSKTLLALNSPSRALGVVGGENGKKILKMLEKINIKEDFIQREEETRMNIKIVDSINHTFTDINESGIRLTEEMLRDVEGKLLSKIKLNDIVVLAGKLPPDTDIQIYQKWIKKIHNKGGKVFLDSDGEEYFWGVKGAPYLIKPNKEELERLIGRSLVSIEEIISAGKELIESGIKKVVVSLGDKGALFIKNDQVFLGHGVKVKVKSTVGAGDAMMGALAYGEEKSLSFKEAAALAIATSSATIIEEGTQSAKEENIKKLLSKVMVEEMTEGER